MWYFTTGVYYATDHRDNHEMRLFLSFGYSINRGWVIFSEALINVCNTCPELPVSISHQLWAGSKMTYPDMRTQPYTFCRLCIWRKHRCTCTWPSYLYFWKDELLSEARCCRNIDDDTSSRSGSQSKHVFPIHHGFRVPFFISLSQSVFARSAYMLFSCDTL